MAIIGLIFMQIKKAWVLKQDAGDGKMKEISDYIYEGALAGPNPRAMLILTEDGHYTLVVMRESLPKFASNNRTVATAEENQAVVAGSLGHFGKYTVDENDRSITFHVDSATFANWDKLPQKRSLALNGDQLSYKVAAASGGGTAEVVWKRIK